MTPMEQHELNGTVTETSSDHEVWCYFNMESRKHGDRLKSKTIEIIDGILKLGNDGILIIPPRYAYMMYKLSNSEWIADEEDVNALMDWFMDNPCIVRMAL